MVKQDKHTFINESLDAIMCALSIKDNDKVISICSCGAQPLALLEHLNGLGEILAVDYNPAQIRFAKKVIKLIEGRKVEELDALNIAPKDRGYFTQKKRLEAIARNLHKLKFKILDVSQKPQINKRFSKGYFSNADVNLKYFHPIFEPGALVYVAFYTVKLLNDIEGFLNNRSEVYGCDIRELYDIDRERTRLACRIEDSKPTVYHSSIESGSIGCPWTPCVFVRK